jgi:hypothetical protein
MTRRLLTYVIIDNYLNFLNPSDAHTHIIMHVRTKYHEHIDSIWK